MRVMLSVTFGCWMEHCFVDIVCEHGVELGP